MFLNVASLGEDSLVSGANSVVVERGEVVCAGGCADYTQSSASRVVDLNGGSLAPGLITFGAPLGLEEISAEKSTNDGKAPDAMNKVVPELLGGDGFVAHAADGLTFGGRDSL